MSLEKKYPKIYAKIIDKELAEGLRDLVVVDENYDDLDSDEFDSFDPDEYNFIIYITDRLQNILGEQKLETLAKNLEKDEHFENFYLDAKDMYGVQSQLNGKEISEIILDRIEGELLL